MTMPGLPKRPAAENIDIDAEGNITGLFIPVERIEETARARAGRPIPGKVLSLP